MRSNALVGAALVCMGGILAGTAPSTMAAGTVHGRTRLERVKGNPSAGYRDFYEWDVFVSPANDLFVGPGLRTGGTWWNGSGCSTDSGDGRYCVSTFAGEYSVFVNQPEFFSRPKQVSDVTLVNGLATEVNLTIPVDYSIYCWDSTCWSWTDPGTVWYQTFKATGFYCTGISYVIADDISGNCNVAILKDNGNTDVRTWDVVAEELDTNIGPRTDNWIRWRSGEVPLMPGKNYAVRLTGLGRTVQPFKRLEDGQGYAYGQAYNENGQPQNFDLHFCVFSDNDGTIVPICRRNALPKLGNLLTGYFDVGSGQTFVASGNKGLAAVDVAAAGDITWDIDFQWKVRQGGPTGPQIGPTKKTAATYFSNPGSGVHGVSFNPDEVPLTKGETYFIEFIALNASGFNPYITDDPYEGTSYQWDGTSWTAHPAQNDISMTVVEYASMPLIELNKESIARTVYMGDLPGVTTFTVQNVGYDTLYYDISDDADWLNVNPSTGSSVTEADTINVTFTGVPDLPVGEHTATISVYGYDVDGDEVVNSPQTIEVTVTVYTVGPDLDGDADVDQADFGLLQTCFSGPGDPPSAGCEECDFEGDNDVDLNDFAIYQDCFSGAGIPANRNCEP